MKIYYKLLIFSTMLIFLSNCSSNLSKSTTSKNILIAKSETKGVDEKFVNVFKVDAALSIATKLTDKYNSISYNIWDTLSTLSLTKPDPKTIAKISGADYLAFIQVNVLKNIMRTQIILVDINDESYRMTGVGYSNIKYIDTDKGNLVYDPALLESLERALAQASNDTNLFVNKDLGIDVKPLPTLVIGSLAFKSIEECEWELDLNKEVSSYAGIETIFDQLKRNNKYVVYDIETRDSAYKNFGFHLIENHTVPADNEIKALYQLGVDYYVTGSVDLYKEKIDLKIGLYEINIDGLKEIKTESETFIDDSRMVFQEHIIRATKRLFGLN